MPTKDIAASVAPKLVGGLTEGAKGLATAMGKRVLSSATNRISDTAQRLTDHTSNGGGPGLMSAITGGGNGGGGAGKSLKVTNIVEQIDVGVPPRLAYDQWTRFTDFPTFMKKVESVEQKDDDTLEWKAQILWSHRTWEATITEQVPDRRIVWTSKGAKGHVDGAVTFHELAPELTRIFVVLEYYPQGFFEGTANLWRAQGRRVRLELKHFARHVMTQAILHPDEVEGWRGEIHEAEVVKDNKSARAEEEQQHRQPERGAPPSKDESQPPRRSPRHGEDGGRASDRPAARSSRPSEDDRPAGRQTRRREEARRPARQERG